MAGMAGELAAAPEPPSDGAGAGLGCEAGTRAADSLRTAVVTATLAPDHRDRCEQQGARGGREA